MSLTLVYDGGCLFCRSFALRSELLGGLPDLNVLDGRADEQMRQKLKARGLRLADGAVLLEYASMEEVPFLQKKCGTLRLGEWAATAAGKGEPSGAVRWSAHRPTACARCHATKSSRSWPTTKARSFHWRKS